MGKAQVVKFPVKCEGPLHKTQSLHKIGVQVAGQHRFLMIVTLVYSVVNVRVRQEKATATFVCNDLLDNSKGSDVDYEKDSP